MKLGISRYLGILLVIFLGGNQLLFGQNDVLSGTDLLDDFLAKEQYEKADSTLQKQLADYISKGQYDSLYPYPSYIGKIERSKTNTEKAAQKASDFIESLKKETTNARTLYKAYLSMEGLYISLGDDKSSVVAAKTALEYALSSSDITQEELGRINYAIGGDYYALYDLSNAVTYFKDAVNAYERSTTVEKDKLADAYNGVAVSMWTLNKLDSATTYFNKAIEATKISNLTSYDRLYYIDAFKFNLALVIDAQGNLGEAIEIKKTIIKNLQTIIRESSDEALVEKSKRLQASAISNLAAFYNDTGYTTKAYEMLKYAYKKKTEVYEPTSPRLVTNLTQIATSELQLQEFDKGIVTANLALDKLKQATNPYPSVEADVLFALARIHTAKDNIEKAKRFYEDSEKLYFEAYPTEYSREYLIMLREYALFLVENNEVQKAISIATKAYDYNKKNGGANNFLILKNMVNLSEIYFKAGMFEQAHQWAQTGTQYLDKKLQTATTSIDSIQIQFHSPSITLLEVQSKYYLTEDKDPAFLTSQLNKLNKAVSFLEERKTTTFDIADINNLLSEYKTLNSFAKQLSYDLLQTTGDEQYLSQTITLHESGIYNRIRTKFNIKNDIAFAHIPPSVLLREKMLKTTISKALNDTDDNQINSFFEASDQWESFQDSLEQHFPKYYNMRYGTIEEPLKDVQKNIPENTTVVRYLTIEKQLYVVVISKTETTLLPLSSEGLSENIQQLAENQFDVTKVGDLLHKLYLQLWQPIYEKITTQKLIIIPDGVLFNLSFETLTPHLISNFKELATHSLLANHQISYNYSLLLLDENRKTIDYSNNFIAFAPQFTDKMKQDYEMAITDSTNTDKTYLTLLSQPFSADIALEYSRLFGGDAFLNEKSTKQVFTNTASEHKIIHIGTHAESNNINPELSRLIFAKNAGNETALEDNSLYTFEIYNQNLSSNLAILTACETGKPSYQAGEGMISLAHAFNYAGSESILTSLWKIDEESSSQILKLFYKNLADGQSKDRALQQAKLAYIRTAEGRTISPQYWAGLVLMGDSQAIHLNTSNSHVIPWIVGVVFLLIFIGFVYRRLKQVRQ